VIGRWGAGRIGVYRAATAEWFLDTNGDNRWTPGVDETFKFLPLFTAGVPVAGDFNPSRPGTEIGVFDRGAWYIDMNGSRTWDAGDAAWPYGQDGDIPVVGAWVGCVGS
jgi:hypothetical protein